MKKIALALILLGIVTTVWGQQPKESNTRLVSAERDTGRFVGEHHVGWIRSHALDNWMVDVTIGPQFYYGLEDRKGSLVDRLTFNAEMHIGRWMFPMVGYRLGGGLGYAHGFITKDSYNTYRPFWGYGTSYGNTVDGNALGGYYWPMDDNNDLYMQKWKYVYGGGDILINLTFLRKYDKVDLSRKWQNIAYAGIDIYMGLSENHPQVTVETNLAGEGHIGWISRYYLLPQLNVYSDLRLSIIEGRFDREYAPNVEITPQDFIFSAHFGACYDFNMRSKKRRKQYYVSRGIWPASMETIPKFAAFVQIDEFSYESVIEHYYTVRYYEQDTPESDTVIMQLQDSINNIKNRWNQVPVNASLKQVMDEHMLPYVMVFYDLDRWDISAEEDMKIAKMAKLMAVYPDLNLILSGSADSKTGSARRNLFLSHNRVDAVYNRLVYGYGISPDRLRREYLGGVMDYEPFELNRSTVIIMDHPSIRKAFNKMRESGKAGNGEIKID